MESSPGAADTPCDIQRKRFPAGSVVKNASANAGDAGSIPGSGRSPGEGNGNPLQYSCLGNPMDGGAWGATVHGVTKDSNTTERLNSNSPEKRITQVHKGWEKNLEPRILQPGNSAFEELWILDSENPRNSRGRDS